MSQSTVSLRYSGSFSSLKSLWGEENNTENDEVGKEEGRRPPKVAFFTSSARYYQPASQSTNQSIPAAAKPGRQQQSQNFRCSSRLAKRDR